MLDFIYLKPQTSGKGFLIVLAGIPVYLIWSRVAAQALAREQSAAAVVPDT
jgi:APA family basic amino acid/polyamine antiporter